MTPKQRLAYSILIALVVLNSDKSYSLHPQAAAVLNSD